MRDDIIKAFQNSLHLEISNSQAEKFENLISLIIETNKKINLTAITEPDQILFKHIIDSLLLFRALDLNKGSSVLDLGTGGGFPGLPLLILRPDLQISFLDSTLKKLNCVQYFLDELDLSGKIIHARAEDYATKNRNEFDYVVSRAVAPLNILSELALPLVKIQGTFIAYKGPDAEKELIDSKKAISLLGGKTVERASFDLTEIGQRNLIIINKIKDSPTKYPRAYSKIKKSPL
ncbi:MAG: 16S rRNA (guanine(527)-N(7))-methyltransferase RsmG [Clostridia bacterium]|nr:16S rRNA (guanine(527)-N(7))-methyltransferase RsmG [Clostridia bacterium]